MSNERPDSQLCACGKVGWTDRQDADRARRVTSGLDRKRGTTARVAVYVCVMTKSGLFHVGHSR